VEAYIYIWEHLDLRHSLGLDAIQRLFILYEATNAPTRLLERVSLDFSLSPWMKRRNCKSSKLPMFMESTQDCHRLTKLYNYRCQSSLSFIQWEDWW
jgi:hypothetical protein